MIYFSKNVIKITAALVLVTTLLTGLPGTASATAFNPNYILSDEEMRDSNAMDFLQISNFLRQKGGLLNQFDIDAVDGLLKGSAQLIDDAAKRYRINPKYILVLLQKESSIIEVSTPTQKQLNWAAGYALCDGCYKSNPLAQKYKGFAKQVDAGASWMNWYMVNAPTLTYLKQPGQTYTVSSSKITPINLATAGLYNYTPHIQGNKLFWNIWQRWFGQGAGEIRLPDGTLIMNEASGAHALIQAGKFRPITNRSVLESRFSQQIPVVVTEDEFRLLEETNPGRPLSFPDLSLVNDETGSVYLLIGSQRRPILSEELFRQIGFNPEEIETVNSIDLQDYRLGEPITLDEAYPLGQLIQDNVTGGVWYVEAGIRRAIWDKTILQARFGQRLIIQKNTQDIEQFKLGDPVIFPDGALVKAPNDPSVFVISEGVRRRIPSEEVFLRLGYRWSTILTCSDKALALHSEGEPLLLFDEPVVATLVGLKNESRVGQMIINQTPD
ncbi:hypothetical protein KKF05_03770 [Patescibacteria group bacterium]|nr:hypothetical protein [Patescibacteria group bacterium]MBU1029427.1 hypothetical protein [Patescibacteria group bacterium]MBU1916449.1 hypothetical protein [Patescibacteria group bacterium]